MYVSASIQKKCVTQNICFHIRYASSAFFWLSTLLLICLHILSNESRLPYSRKYWRGIKFGGLAVCEQTAKLKSANFYSRVITSFIRYIPKRENRQIKIRQFRFSTIFAQSAKYNSRQYFRLYGMCETYVASLR